MQSIIDLLIKVVGQVWLTLQHNWPFLLMSILIAAAMQLYVDQKAIAGFLRRHQRGGVLAATAAAVATPLCSCGTTAIVLGMMAGSMPWAPIVAFMVASPLTSPEELFYSAGLFGWPFALAFFVASIMLGLLGGVIAALLDARGVLRNQARLTATTAGAAAQTGCGCKGSPARLPEPVATACACAAAPQPAAVPTAFAWTLPVPQESCACNSASDQASGVSFGSNTAGPTLPIFLYPAQTASPGGQDAQDRLDLYDSSQLSGFPETSCKGATCIMEPELDLVPTAPCGCSAEPVPAGQETLGAVSGRPHFNARTYLRQVVAIGRRLVVLFISFAFIGYLINDLIPAAWITALFGVGHSYSVLLAATLGLPFYINTEASLPLVRAMLDSGMSSGAALAFLITGAGTSLGAVAGALTIARWRVLGVVIATLWVGAILCGLTYDALAATAMF